MRLRDDQLWFARAVMTEDEGAEAAHRLTPGPRLTAIERLDIYRRGYEARLVECLADDYPILKHALGEVAFRGLCREYIARFPSEAPNLNAFGRHMPVFCQGFAADLAALEWAVVEAVHAADASPLTSSQLAAVAADMWPSARLEKCPSLVVLRAAYPVNDYFQAVRDGHEPELPDASPSATAVYRRGLTVWRQGLTRVMADVLEALARGETLEASVAGVPDDQPAEQVLSWFREWVQAGLFVAIDVSAS
jgi:Putative DNA-binding domain